MSSRTVCSACAPACLQKGVTLLEALVVMAVIGLLLGLSVPALSGLRQQHQLQAQAQGLLDSLVLARSQALRLGERVTICARRNDAECDPAGQWQQGWLVFVDGNSSGLREPTEPVLENHGEWPSQMHLSVTGTTRAHLSYGSQGRSQTISGAYWAGTFSVCNSALAQGWQLVVNAVGKPRLQKYTPTRCG